MEHYDVEVSGRYMTVKITVRDVKQLEKERAEEKERELRDRIRCETRELSELLPPILKERMNRGLNNFILTVPGRHFHERSWAEASHCLPYDYLLSGYEATPFKKGISIHRDLKKLKQSEIDRVVSHYQWTKKEQVKHWGYNLQPGVLEDAVEILQKEFGTTFDVKKYNDVIEFTYKS
jgi:hypothetical protein